MAFNVSGRSSKRLPLDANGLPIYNYQEPGTVLLGVSGDVTITNGGVAGRGVVGGATNAGLQELGDNTPAATPGIYALLITSAGATPTVTVYGPTLYDGAGALTASHTYDVSQGMTIYGDWTRVTTSSTVKALLYKKYP